jgi:MraZ protein
VFRGEFHHTIDPKGRLSIPAKFREVLADGFGEKLVIVPINGTLEVHPLKLWKEDIEDKVNALPRFDPDARAIKYAYISKAQDVSLDPQGRIQISADYRERAALVKNVLVIGMGTWFEVCSAERRASSERESPVDIDALYARLAAKGI